METKLDNKTLDETYERAGYLMRVAMERRKDRPKLIVLQFLGDKMEEAIICNLEPNWKSLFKQAKQLWDENL